MDPRKFNSHMHFVNEIWAAKVLNMQVSSKNGPDLIDDYKAIEVKFERIYPEVKTHKCWRFLGHQLDYNKTYKEIYWGLGFYNLNKMVSDVKQRDLNNLEKFVDYREIYLVDWDWMNQFPLYHQKGKTNISEWDHFIGYPKFRLIPKVILSREVKDGKVFFTQGVNPDRFNLDENFSYQNTYKDTPF